MMDIGTLGGDNSDAFGYNDAGQIVGWAQDQPGGKFYHAFLWQSGSMTNLGEIGGFDTSQAEAVNNAGQVVGIGKVQIAPQDSSATFEEHAFIYSALTGVVLLESVIPVSSGWTELSPRDINDSGEIVGDGTINGARHAFLMTPPPIPTVSTWGLLAFAVGILILGTLVLRRRGSTQRR